MSEAVSSRSPVGGRSLGEMQYTDWGERAASIGDWTAQRPDWDLAVLHGVGHAPPLEVPADHARTVIDWCGSRVPDR